MFRRSSDDIHIMLIHPCFMEAVVGLIGKLVDDTIQKITIKTFPNQKPWVDKIIRDALSSRTAAYKAGIATGNMDEYKIASYNTRRVLKEAKRRYGRKVDSRSLWLGLRTITDYKTPVHVIAKTDASLADDLNTFYARFEAASHCANGAAGANKNKDCMQAESINAEKAFIITEGEVRRIFQRVDIRKAVGPDGISGGVLKACADQLAPVFTEIFNLSLEQSKIPTCFKQSIIVPIPKKSQPSCLNDYRPVALTSIVMKCFERLVRNFITSLLPDTLDSLLFAYRPNLMMLLHIFSTQP